MARFDANATGELRAIVEKRWQAAAAKAADGPDDSLGLRARTDELICLSGGQLRVLFEIVRQTVVRAPRLDALDIAIRSQVDQLATGVDAAKRLLLSRVHETNDAFTDDPNWQNLLRNGRILRYRGDATWYDAHPLLARWLAERMERGLA